MICDIKHKEVELKGYYCNTKEMGMVREAKVMKCGKDNELEKALFKLYLKLNVLYGLHEIAAKKNNLVQ